MDTPTNNNNEEEGGWKHSCSAGLVGRLTRHSRYPHHHHDFMLYWAQKRRSTWSLSYIIIGFNGPCSPREYFHSWQLLRRLLIATRSLLCCGWNEVVAFDLSRPLSPPLGHVNISTFLGVIIILTTSAEFIEIHLWRIESKNGGDGVWTQL